MTKMTLRLSNVQLAQIEQLAEKLQVDKTNVIRLAISDLALKEGVTVKRK